MIYLLCTAPPLPPRFECWGLLRHRGRGDPELFTSFRRVPLSFSFSFILQGECVSACSCSLCQRSVRLSPPILLFSESEAALLRLHDVRGERNDSSSLEQERAGNNLLSPPCPVLYCLSFAVPLALAPVTSQTDAFICSLCLSLRLSSDPNAVGQHGTDHALIGGVVAVVVFVTLCLIIVLGRYLARHKGKTTVDQT